MAQRTQDASLRSERRFTVETFGLDCLGNVTGWRVYHAQSREVMGQFVGNLYVTGSHAAAKVEALDLCDYLNSGDADYAPGVHMPPAR